jgi:hypothetical protein
MTDMTLKYVIKSQNPEPLSWPARKLILVGNQLR